MKKITLSINPTYHCNFRCPFCYLTETQLSDHQLMPLEMLKFRINEINEAGYLVDHVDLYGGEIGLLPMDYLESLDEALLNAGDPSINVITNLSVVHPYFLKDHVSLSVSFDFKAREKSYKVLQNMISIPKEISILMLASRQLLELPIDNMIKTFNQIQNIISVEIKPYSTNQSNQQNVTDTQYEDYVKTWLLYSAKMDFEFKNRYQLDDSLKGLNNAFSDDHIYITPNGKFAILEFDENSHELFSELNNFSEYIKWSNEEKQRVHRNEFCRQCEYLGHCLTEHYRNVQSLENSCNGFKGLLDWYASHLVQSPQERHNKGEYLHQN